MSSSLLFLDHDDFEVRAHSDGSQIMGTNIKGFSLIFFYSTECQHCEKCVPIIKGLPSTLGGCKFGMINVSNNKHVVTKSQGTKTQITYVPLIILYIDGMPYLQYNGPHETEPITKFIIEASQMYKSEQSKSGQTQQTTEQTQQKVSDGVNHSKPAYCLGLPCNSKNKVCNARVPKDCDKYCLI